MTRWLIVPVLCALAMPSTASAQAPASPPPAEAATEAPVALAAPAEGSKAARSAEAALASEAATPAVDEATVSVDPSAAAEPALAEAPIAAPPPPPPRAAVAIPPAPTGPQRNKRAEPLLITGLSGFATVYLLTAYVGAATIDKARDLNRGDNYDYYGNPEPGRNGNMTRNRGRALLIPVAGPFIAMHFTNSARRKYWQAVNGGLQAGTLAMAIIGSRMFAKHRRAKRRAQVTASASGEGAQLGMSMRF
ncbi:MAG: hypothetical protein ACRBN8_15415 [Nannocystales bacterium]